MQKTRFKAFGLALVGALAFLFAGCGQQGGGGNQPHPATTGKVTLVVVDNATSQGVSGYNATYTPAISDVNSVTPGDYTVKVTKSGYFDAFAAFKVRAGETTTVNVSLVPVPQNTSPGQGKVAVLVVNESGQPIQGATVSDGTNSATTGANGQASLTYTAAGDYAISVNASGYQGAAQLAHVELGKTTALTFTLKQGASSQTGTLVVHVYAEDTGQTLTSASVSASPALTFSGSNGLFTASAAPNTYAVSATAPGYLQGQRAIQVKAGETAVLNLGLKRNTASGPVGGIEIVSVKDKWGVDLFGTPEVNPAKKVNLYASQTEEPVCVTVKVTNNNQPVAGARVRVTAVSADPQAVALYKGCETQNVSELDFVTTDANGIAKFSFQGLGKIPVSPAPGDEPVKFLVSASEESSGFTASSKEFKVFFFNITHLFFQDKAGTLPPQLEGFFSTPGKPAQKRSGFDFGTIVNFYSDNRDQMAHSFNSYVQQKQPATGGRFYPGGPNLSYYMEYALIGGNTGDVRWTAGCEAISPDGLKCQDQNGSGVSLNLKPTVTKDQLPKQVQVKATMYVQVTYGTTTYTFPLKDYTFTKRWESAFLQINKYVDNHVLTWAGPSRTLLAKDDPNAPADSVYTSTVHVVVTNPSQNSLYNVVVRDALPPELGVVTGTISNNGVYDPVNHSITWSYTNFAALNQVNPGQTLEFTFQVYVRQKPGFCANPGLVPTPNTYIIPPLYGPGGIATM